MKKILYLSLSGMTEALGRSQVFEYLIDLSKINKVYLISFERESDLDNLDEIKELAYQNNIVWKYFNYSNKYGVFSTVLQIFTAVYYASKIIRQNSIDIVHSRSMIPATMAVILKKIHNIKHLFDIRGFVFDEKADSGRLDKNSFLYKSLIKFEYILYKNSDHIVTLTDRSKDIISDKYLIEKEKITVIPTCANKEIFKLLSKEEKEKFKLELGYGKNEIILIHTGAVTNSYDFTLEVKVFKELNKKNSNIKFLVVNKGQHEYVESIFEKFNIEKSEYKIVSSNFNDMHKYLNIANASIFFIPPTYSKLASTPTKFAENLLCYLPSITNSGVGDMDFYINTYNVGKTFEYNMLDKNIDRNIDIILTSLSIQINSKNFDQLYNKYFDKDRAVETYDKIYKNMLYRRL